MTEDAQTPFLVPMDRTPLHSHGGLTLVVVTEGEMTVRSAGRETVYRPGDLWIERPGDIHAAGNVTATTALVAVTFLLRQGDPVTTVATDQTPAQLPRALPRTGDPGGSPILAAMAAAAVAAMFGAGLYLRRRTS